MQAQKGEEGETRCWGWKSAIPQSGCRPRILSSSLRTVMFGERANRVFLGSVGNRSRFFTATLFLLFTFATSVWTDNSTGSVEGPSFIMPIRNVTIPMGRKAVLTCVVANLSIYKVNFPLTMSLNL
ncbi:uncharacterized protein LOC105737023 [Apis florea]|uniref:uncharacterized protein LOC105737023 n=1 Tax=Apis florea TaxID=7463 RepID=UPI000629AADD|nr:uncharacterized protein LOC105737023 [Apis florea]